MATVRRERYKAAMRQELIERYVAEKQAGLWPDASALTGQEFLYAVGVVQDEIEENWDRQDPAPSAPRPLYAGVWFQEPRRP